jgi:hypothetical protein
VREEGNHKSFEMTIDFDRRAARASDPPIARPPVSPYRLRGVSSAQITKALSAITTIAQTG